MYSRKKTDMVRCCKYVSETTFMTLETPNFVVKLKDGNNIIQFVDSLMVVDSMTRVDDNNCKGVVFKGTVYPQHLKRSLYSIAPFETSSIDAHEFLIDMSSPDQDKDYSFFCSDAHIMTKVKKIMKIPVAFEPLDCCFAEMLHTRGNLLSSYDFLPTNLLISPFVDAPDFGEEA